jgi:uncharacterized protein
MDEILASIRRIIDAGENQSHQNQAAAPAKNIEPVIEEPAQIVTIPPEAANDAGVEMKPPQAKLAQQPQTALAAPQRVAAGDEGRDLQLASAVDSYLATERGKKAVHAPAETAAAEFVQNIPEPDISEIEAALEAEFGEIDRDLLMSERQAKYDARFTEADNGAFQQVGSLLRGTLSAEPDARENEITAKPMPLVSESVSRSVSSALSGLSGLMTENYGRDIEGVAEEMLRPMLQDWLDNNLPSLVERLVRAEIERIARGEPRGA